MKWGNYIELSTFIRTDVLLGPLSRAIPPPSTYMLPRTGIPRIQSYVFGSADIADGGSEHIAKTVVNLKER